MVALQYLKIMIILKNFYETKPFNQTIRFVSEKVLKKRGSISGGRLHRALTEDLKLDHFHVKNL